jgi:hypothetical protein
MPRQFVPISREELQDKIVKAEQKDPTLTWTTLTPKIERDIKVSFNDEKVIEDSGPPGLEHLVGYHTLSNDLTFLGLVSGGSWEIGIFFIIYYDGKQLRAYIPTDGNLWNTVTNEAYGNDRVEDYLNWNERFPDNPLEDEDDDLDPGEYNEQLIIQDIKNSIQIRREL